ncbi:MAG: hypothetical protein GC164_06605 [Phycisphaera sp.]|nr:hypothetical protein [Phycisphaera sp.]
MSFSSPTRSRVGPVLPLASMVDILFITLVFFLAISQFRQQDRQIDVNLPGQQTSSKPASPTQIVITITPDSVIHMGTRSYTLNDLRQTLGELARRFPDESVLIRGDRESPLGLTVQVLDAARAAGLRNAYIATTRSADEL